MKRMVVLATGLSLMCAFAYASDSPPSGSGSIQTLELNTNRLKLEPTPNVVLKPGSDCAIIAYLPGVGYAQLPGIICTVVSSTPTTPATTTDGGDEAQTPQ